MKQTIRHSAASNLRLSVQGSVGGDNPDEDRKSETISVAPSIGGSIHSPAAQALASSFSSSSSSKWTPYKGLFQDYSLVQKQRRQQQQQHSLVVGGAGSMKRAGNLRLVVTQPLVARLTRFIYETFQLCNPSFTYSESFNPKRNLTHPSTGVSNNGLDNSNSDLILSVNGVLLHPGSNQRYIVKDLLGQGTFGQVAKCWADQEESFVAVKVIKNQPAYYQQALVEISILTMLNKKFDPDDKHHLVRIADHFFFQGHLCIVFELLSVNLFELLKVNHYRGISLHLLRLFIKQILNGLAVLRDASVIHCDLKPENILLTSLQSGEIKIIDFGSACMENRPVYSYIQSRFYRSPEVVLGHPYTTAIDMWSLGCIAAELFLGVPLFPGESEYDLLKRMIETLGYQPPDHLLRNAKSTAKYFKHTSAAPPSNSYDHLQRIAYQFVTEEEYEAREKKRPAIGKHRHRFTRLGDIILNYPLRSKVSEAMEKEHQSRLSFIDFIKGLVQFDPVKRWTPHQAALHPFVTEQPFTEPFNPPPETPRTPVCQAMAVKHNPGAGHWFAAGLSPQVNSSRDFQYNPQIQPHRLSYASSHGSYGSVGSYGDGINPGSSYGSYGDFSSMYLNYPTPPTVGKVGQMHGGSGLGLSPDMWRRVAPLPPGYASLGMSPSGSSLKPMSVGGSPSQLIPSGPQFLSPHSPSQLSPNRYVQNFARGGSLGKAAAVAHYNKRRGWGSPLSGSPQEGIMPYGHRYPQSESAGLDGVNSHMEGHARANHLGSPRGASMQGPTHIHPWRHQMGGHFVGAPSSVFRPKLHGLHASAPLGSLLSSKEVAVEGDDIASPPDPADWDPNYSGDDLLQDELNDNGGQGFHSVGVIGSGGTRLGPGPSSIMSSGQGPGGARSMLPMSNNQHSNRHVPGESINSPTLSRSVGQVRGPFSTFRSLEGSPPSHSQGYVCHQQPAHARSKSKFIHHGPFSPQQTSPSRLGQQSSHFFQKQRQQHRQYSHHPNPSMQTLSEGNSDTKATSHNLVNEAGAISTLHLFPSARQDSSLHSTDLSESGGGSSLNMELQHMNNPLNPHLCPMPHAAQRVNSQIHMLEQPASWLSLSSAVPQGHCPDDHNAGQPMRSHANADCDKHEHQRQC